MPKIVGQAAREEEFSFVRAARRRFGQEFTRIKEKYELNSMVLVLDLDSAKFISSLFTITELVAQGVVFVERLERVRKTLDHHAIYFITPCESSIECMLQDYKDKDCRYRKAHVLFSSALERTLIKKISTNHFFLKRLARHSFKEFYFEVSALAGNSLHFSIDYLSLAFSKESNIELEARVKICRRFVDLVSGYDSLNVVRVYYESSANLVAERIAERAAVEIKAYLAQLLENKSAAIREDAPDLTIYITDRSVDIITPLIHGYSYESLLYDIATPNQQHADKDSDHLKGAIFDQYRYRHLAHALASLPEKLEEIVKKINECEKLKAVEIRQLKEEREELEAHLEILRGLWEKFKEKNLQELGEIQLCLTTGVTDEGKQTSSSELFDNIVKIIKNSINLCPDEILRLALLTVICIKLSQADYETLMSLFKEPQKAVLANLAVFGIRYDRKISKSTKAIDKLTMDRARAKLETHEMASERFTCALEIMIPRLIDFLKIQSGKVEKKYLEEIMVSVTEAEGVEPKFNDKRMICFMCGGLSQTEICSLRKNEKLRNVLLATDSILTPNQFVQALSRIDLLSK